MILGLTNVYVHLLKSATKREEPRSLFHDAFLSTTRSREEIDFLSGLVCKARRKRVCIPLSPRQVIVVSLNILAVTSVHGGCDLYLREMRDCGSSEDDTCSCTIGTLLLPS